MIDQTGFINCIWFHGISWIVDKFQIGDNIAIYGKIEFYRKEENNLNALVLKQLKDEPTQ